MWKYQFIVKATFRLHTSVFYSFYQQNERQCDCRMCKMYNSYWHRKWNQWAVFRFQPSCIQFRTNVFEKSMNPSLLLRGIGLEQSRLATSLGKGLLWIQNHVEDNRKPNLSQVPQHGVMISKTSVVDNYYWVVSFIFTGCPHIKFNMKWTNKSWHIKSTNITFLKKLRLFTDDKEMETVKSYDCPCL